MKRTLLSCGLASGLVFFIVGLGQAFTRAGFDLRVNALSLLSLGDLGWLQITNFLVSGMLALACAVGVRRAIAGERGGTWGPIAIALFGLGLIIAGICRPDPAFGYPPGAPPGQPTTMSGHGAGHALGFFLCLLATIIGVIVFARRFSVQGRRGWVTYLVATAVAGPVLIALSAMYQNVGGIIVAVAGAVMFGWVAVVPLRLA